MARYRERTYRELAPRGRLVRFQVKLRETDLLIKARRDLSHRARELIFDVRAPLEAYIETHPVFLTSLIPLPEDPLAPPLVKEMLSAASAANVGPMASVAGAIAQEVGEGLMAESPEVIVENGGDIFLKVETRTLVSIFAGPSPLSHRIGVAIEPEQTPLGVCTSSGTVGHSLSLGSADAVTVVSRSAALADAAATSLANLVKGKGDIPRALDAAQGIPGIIGVVAVKDDKVGAWGRVELAPLSIRGPG